MWTMYVATYHGWISENAIDERFIEADNIVDLVRYARNIMGDGKGLYLFVPSPNNPPLSLDQYAELLGEDIAEDREAEITGHFATWVRYGRVIIRPLYQYKRSLKYGYGELW
jgi:hypothetical protein